MTDEELRLEAAARVRAYPPSEWPTALLQAFIAVLDLHYGGTRRAPTLRLVKP